MSAGSLTAGPATGRAGSPTLVLVATSIGLALVLGGLASAHPRWAAVAVVGAVLVTGAIFVRALGCAVGLVVLLIVTCLIDRYTFAVGSLNIRPEQVAALLALVVLVVVRFRQRRLVSLRPNLIEVALLAWFAVGLISSVVEAPARGESLKILALLVLSALAMFLPRRLLADREKLELIVQWLLLALAIESVYALLTYFLHVFGPTVSLSVNPVGGHLLAYGTLWEPNVLGGICGAGAVAWVYLGRRYFSHAWIGVALCLGASVVSLTRSAWAAVAIVLAISLATSIRRHIHVRSLALGAAATVVVIGAVLAVDAVGGAYYPLAQGTANPIATPSAVGGGTPVTPTPTGAGGSGTPVTPTPTGAGGSGTHVTPTPNSAEGGRPFGGFGSRIFAILANGVDLVGRLHQFEVVLGDLRSRPIFGGGINSYGERHKANGVSEHLANVELAAVNDTGLLGLLVFAIFMIAIVVATQQRRRDPIVLGLGMMTLVVAITNQATETLELMITWLLIGLLLCAIELADEVNPSTTVDRAQGTGS